MNSERKCMDCGEAGFVGIPEAKRCWRCREEHYATLTPTPRTVLSDAEITDLLRSINRALGVS
jgi:hypothetical protein